jgi:hypothetical protein
MTDAEKIAERLAAIVHRECGLELARGPTGSLHPDEPDRAITDAMYALIDSGLREAVDELRSIIDYSIRDARAHAINALAALKGESDG